MRVGAIRVIACWLALALAAPAQQYVFRAYRQSDGLRNLAINDLALDRAGFVWVATENGVFRFVGSGFEHYGREEGIAESVVENLVSDPNGTIWVSTAKNLYRLEKQRFVPAGPNPIEVRPGPLFLMSTRGMAVLDGRHLLVADQGRGGLYRLEHDTEGRMQSYLPVFPEQLLKQIPDLADIMSVSVVHDAKGGSVVWAGGGHKLYSWPESNAGDGTLLQAGTVKKWGPDQGLGEDFWFSVITDREGTVWASGQARVAVLRPGATRFEDRSIHNPSETGNGHGLLAEDREGRMLAAAVGGLERWDGTHWQMIGRANGLPFSGQIWGLAFDATGDLWVGSMGGGLFQWTGYDDWEGWKDESKLPSSAVFSLTTTSPQGRVMVGTDMGPASIDPRTGLSGVLYKERKKWSAGQTSAIWADEDGSAWVGSSSGALFNIDPHSGHAQLKADLHSYITSIFGDGRHIYLTSVHGILARSGEDGSGAVQLVDSVHALVGDTTFWQACKAPDGADWFLSNHGPIRLKDGAWNKPSIDGMPALQGLQTSLSCAPDGSLWVSGQQDGVYRLTVTGDRLTAWKLELPDDLRTLSTVAILADRRGWLWLGTDQGIAVWNGRQWHHLTQESGLIWNDVDLNTMSEASDGSLWVGTSGGLTHMLHPQRIFDPVPLTAALTSARRGNERLPVVSDYVLPWSGQNLEFQFSSPTGLNRSELRFRYRLKGLESDWSDGTDPMIRFSGLPPGTYALEVMAVNPGLNSSSKTVLVNLRILAPWWRSLWFLLLCAIAIAALVAIGVRFRERRLQETSRHLEELVSKRTRDLELSQKQLSFQATHDGLTGMVNRTAILSALSEEVERAFRESKAVIVGLIDLDYFKRINDTYGHRSGDEALLRFAKAVDSSIRNYDHAGRYGGEEFLLVLPIDSPMAADKRLSSLHRAISNLEVQTENSSFTVNCSIGAAIFDPLIASSSIESLLARADQALYAAKEKGRNCVAVADAELSRQVLDA